MEFTYLLQTPQGRGGRAGMNLEPGQLIVGTSGLWLRWTVAKALQLCTPLGIGCIYHVGGILEVIAIKLG